MFVPIVPKTTIINKTIVYSDTVLSLKDNGNNLIVTSINDVSDDSLEKCLKIIFESNPNVVFNTIQYSKQNKKVYFYTNEKITTKNYEESKFIEYKPITSKTLILEEVKNILSSPKNKNSDCISLYDVSKFLKTFHYEYDNIKEQYNNKLDNIAKNKFNKDSSVVVHDFDYKNKILHISFKKYYSGDYIDIYFSKQNGDLYISKAESYYASEFFNLLSSILSNLYDELLKYNDYKDFSKSKYATKTVNSNFLVNISNYGVEIFIKNYETEFKLFAPSYTNNYSFECNSNIVNEAFKGKEDEIFKRIFVKINDCPKWSQALLYEIRQNQLAEEEKIEDREMKKQKRLEFTRKIFPFLKK